MKKHIKKIICLVAVLVVCVTAFVVPCFAYTQYDYMSLDLLGANLVTPSVIINNRNSDTRIGDVFPNYLYDNSMNDMDSDAWYVDEVYTDDDNLLVIRCIYYLTTDLDATATLNFPMYKVRNDDPNFLSYHQYVFSGYYEFDLTIKYYGDNGDYDEYIYHIEELDTTAEPTRWEISDFFPVDVGDGSFFVYITNFSIIEPTDFYIDIPYYNVEYLADLPNIPVTTSNIVEPVYIDNVPFGDFLWDSITGFLEFQILPGVQLYHILTATIAIPLFIWFLKLFSGG